MSSSLYRTYSSPNLRDSYGKKNWEWQGTRNKYFSNNDDVEDAEFYIIGDRVLVDGDQAASVAYFGEVAFASGDWVGLVLDEPVGNHAGKLHGREYFQCAPMHGLFVRPNRLLRLPAFEDSAFGGSSATSSRIGTPLPSYHQSFSSSRRSCGSNSRSPAASSTMDSYFYDDDYRRPTVASLARKLKFIEQQDDHSSDLRNRFESSPVLPRTRRGILKQQRSESIEPLIGGSSIGARAEQLSRRINKQASQQSSPLFSNRLPAVFNFRPRRTQLDADDDCEANQMKQATGAAQGYSRIMPANEPPKLNERVVVHLDRGEKLGVLRFMGETNFAIGEWAGVELDEREGRNDGSILGHRYFNCQPDYGLFVPATRVRKYTNNNNRQAEFKSIRSTITSPPPVMGRHSTSSYSLSGSQSTTPATTTSSSPATSSPMIYGSSLNKRLYSPTTTTTTTTTPKLFQDTPLPLRSINSNSINSRLSYHQDTKNDDVYDGEQHHDRWPKFDERDIEVQLKKDMRRRPIIDACGGVASGVVPIRSQVTSSNMNLDSIRPRSVKYTFSSSKYDGNPIARRTVEYN